MPKVSLLGGMMRNSDLALAVAVIAMLAMMVIPMPPFLLSLFLALNLTLAMLILLVSIYTQDALEFSAFPSLLLITTLFRLSLNVSSTRLILLNGYAGEVIERFGQFVVGGNPVVGFIVFLILVVIQFVVITRGAERVSEVAARFTLDAMPGKQMAIDADLNAGLIDEREARRRRRDIEREADFYGAMDGASKFVKGDAIAGLVITAINIAGGFIVGMLQKGLPWNESLQRYTLLTVGDGLVTQIPALLISTATGMVVTRAASETHLGQDISRQLLSQPRGLAITAGALGVLGLIPGLPNVPFLAMAGFFGALAAAARDAARRAPEAPPAGAAEEPPGRGESHSPESVVQLLPIDPLEIELGYGLLGLADPERGGDLMERVGLVRRQVALDLGFVVPLVRVRDNMQIAPNQYVFKLRGAEVARGELMAERLLALDPGTADDGVPGLAATDPVFGLPAKWIAPEDRDRAEAAGYTVVEPAAVLATHLTHLVRTRAHELLGRQEVKQLLDKVRETNAVVVDELVPNLLTNGEVQKVLQNLLREGVPIRDMVTVLETLADWAPVTRDPERLTEAVRQALGRYITRDLPVQEGRLAVLALDPQLEERLAPERAGSLGQDPALLQRVLSSLEEEGRKLVARGLEPVVVCSPPVRLHFKRWTERALPNLKVVSYNEIAHDVELEVVGMVRA